MSILCAGAFSSSPLLSMGTITVSFPGYLSYREMPGNENSYREMPGNENAARKKSSLAGHMYTYVCIRMAREARKSCKYEGQLTKPELNTYVCRRPVSRCQRLVGVNSHSVVLIVTD